MQEVGHSALPGKLYLQIEKLAELRDIDVRMVLAEGPSDQELPVFMHMGDASEGRMELLNYLSGPTKLENIGGSFLADTEETDWTMKRRRVAACYER